MKPQLKKILIVAGIAFALFLIWFGLRLYTENKLADSTVSFLPKLHDVDRTRAVQDIQRALEGYSSGSGIYPKSLSILEETHEIYPMPTDPVTQKFYSYTQLDGGKSYSLCIDFEAKPHKCFNPTINP